MAAERGQQRLRPAAEILEEILKALNQANQKLSALDLSVFNKILDKLSSIEAINKLSVAEGRIWSKIFWVEGELHINLLQSEVRHSLVNVQIRNLGTPYIYYKVNDEGSFEDQYLKQEEHVEVDLSGAKRKVESLSFKSTGGSVFVLGVW